MTFFHFVLVFFIYSFLLSGCISPQNENSLRISLSETQQTNDNQRVSDSQETTTSDTQDMRQGGKAPNPPHLLRGFNRINRKRV